MRRSGPKTILILLPSLPAEGTPTLALDLVRIWQRAGFELQVATFFSETQEMLPEFASLGINVHCLNLAEKGPGKFFALPYKVHCLCRAFRPSAILCFPFGWHGYLSGAAWLAGVKRVVAHAGNYPPTESRLSCNKMALAAWLAVPFGSQIACCSSYVRQGLIKHLKIPARYLRTVYNGIDIERFCAPSNFLVAKKLPGIRCGMVARLEGHKDQPTLIRAIRILLDRGVQINLELVGEGSRRNELLGLITQLNLADHVHLLGTKRNIPEVLHSWDMFAFSVSASEGLGIALIEALAAGLPVVASDVGACREVLCPPHQEPLGMLVPEQSPLAMADAIIACSQAKDGPRMAMRAMASVNERFSMQAMAKNYLSLLALE